MPDLFKEIGEKLRQLRLAKGWSQEELASESSQSQPNISALEKGKDIRISTLVKTAEALGYPAWALLKLYDTDVRPKASDTRDSLLGELVTRLASLDETQLSYLMSVSEAFSQHGEPKSHKQSGNSRKVSGD